MQEMMSTRVSHIKLTELSGMEQKIDKIAAVLRVIKIKSELIILT